MITDDAAVHAPVTGVSAPSDRPSLGEQLWSHRALIVGLVFAAVAAVVAVRIRPVILYDDAAIIGRYIRRIVAGDGWTYNDGDRTNGLSSPLYGIASAFVHLVGFDPIVALRIVCTAGYAGTIGLVAYLGTRTVGLVGGVVGGSMLLVWYDFASQGLSGMESTFATFLALATLVALVHDRENWAGVFLGLALFNKLDAGLLAVAIAVAYVAVRHRPPWRIAAVSAAVVAPWFAFSTVYFGSPLPYSFSQKAGGQVVNPTVDPTPWWVVDSLSDQEVIPVVALAALALAVAAHLAVRGRQPAAIAVGAAVLWAVGHGTAFSLLDLGDRYPWYMTALYPPLAYAAGCTVGYVFNLVRTQRAGLTIPALVATAVVFGVATHGASTTWDGRTRTLIDRVQAGPATNDYLQFEIARRAAGQRIDELAEPGEVVATCYGWIAYGAFDNTILETCPLNTRRPVGPEQWSIMSYWPDTGAPTTDDPSLVESIRSEGVELDGRVDIHSAGP